MKGFTLIETLVAIVLVGVLLTVGIPGLRQLVIGNQRTAISTDLYSDLQQARSQAIARNQRVSVCKSADGAGCLAIGHGSWTEGWLVFANPSGAPSPTSADAILSVHEPLPAAFTLAPQESAIQTQLSFAPDGHSLAAGAFKLCHQSPNIVGRKQKILASGAIVVSETACP